ncbi:MAG: UDP-3-O-(3-hydroxymyristoyl)glucosamine N-acyltransferase [Leptospiraceae bacterium]|nr:UDP-3-O-(3-hydroxymyristoyl)glucosamine N-acyltransferase [Leptospiraceae bacterium]MDW7975512.1 UDP-3-O-(3-hydroxymyristoyl)glucosamine N-acyltransferase [Leptospiraceae bacterium]
MKLQNLKKKLISLDEINEKLKKHLDFEIYHASENQFFVELKPIEEYTKDSIVFLNNKKFIQYLNPQTPPKAVVTNKEIFLSIKESYPKTVFFVSKNVDVFRALFLQHFFDYELWDVKEEHYVHPSAEIHPSVELPQKIYVGPNVVIGENVKLGENVYLGANVVIEAGVQIGDNTILFPNVYVGWGCIIGKNCRIHPGTVIGSEGFGFAQDEQFRHYRIPQLGIVEIEDDVVIGANCCIDRATYDKTIIRKGVITDNLIHVAHNCDIGENSILVAQVGIAGSSKLGKRVICSGQVGIADHVQIPDDTILLGRTAVLSDIPESGIYLGYPAIPSAKFHRIQLHLQKLEEYAKEIKALKKRMEELEKKHQ